MHYRFAQHHWFATHMLSIDHKTLLWCSKSTNATVKNNFKINNDNDKDKANTLTAIKECRSQKLGQERNKTHLSNTPCYFTTSKTASFTFNTMTIPCLYIPKHILNKSLLLWISSPIPQVMATLFLLLWALDLAVKKCLSLTRFVDKEICFCNRK